MHQACGTCGVELAIDMKITDHGATGRSSLYWCIYLHLVIMMRRYVLRGQQEYYVCYGIIPSPSSIQGPNDSYHEHNADVDAPSSQASQEDIRRSFSGTLGHRALSLSTFASG